MSELQSWPGFLNKMEWTGETHIPAEQARSQAPARFPGPHGDCRRPSHHRRPPCAGPEEPFRLIPSLSPIRASELPGKDSPVPRLKKRSDFLRASKGDRFHARAFTLQAAKLLDKDGVLEQESALEQEPLPKQPPARFGITITKRVGNAVQRNRMRRRFKEALRLTHLAPRAGRDYVIIAKAEALTADFQALQSDLSNAIRKIDRPARSRPPKAEASRTQTDWPKSSPNIQAAKRPKTDPKSPS
jgi:ribonuclease P protein component